MSSGHVPQSPIGPVGSERVGATRNWLETGLRASGLVGISVLASSIALAQPATDAGRTSPFELAASLDALDLARAASRAGDGGIEHALSDDGADRRIQRIALESAPFAHAPIRLVSSIGRLAAGRDPDVAPAAMRVLVDIVEHSTARDLARHEVMPSDLASTRDAMRRLRRDPTGREDLRSAAARVDAMLGSLLE